MRARHAVVSALIALAAASSAEAAQRSFVSTTGLDANACTLAAPCRSFGTALTHTDAGGEIIVLDSGAYGRVTITQPVTIEAPAGVYAGISVFASTNGIDVNAPGATVVLRGLSINGQGGNIGISVAAVKQLSIDRCRINGMGAQGVLVTAGSVVITHAYINDNGHDGVLVSGQVDVLVRDTVSVRNLSGVSFFAGARGVLHDTVLSSNRAFGIYEEGGPTATPTTVRAEGIEVNYSGSTGIYVKGLASSLATIAVVRSTVSSNFFNGLWVDGAAGPVTGTVSDSSFTNHPALYPAFVASGTGARAVVSGSVFVDNGSWAFWNSGALAFDSRGDNTLRNNNGGAAQTSAGINTFGGM
jgi:parallel beta helix pectate lyase-like protein